MGLARSYRPPLDPPLYSFSSDEVDLVLYVIAVCPRTSDSPSPPDRSSLDPPPGLQSICRELCAHPPGRFVNMTCAS